MTFLRRNLLTLISFVITQSVLAASLPTASTVSSNESTKNKFYGVEIYTLDVLQKSGHILSTDEAQKIVSFWHGRKTFGQLSSAGSYADEIKNKTTGTIDMSTVTHVVSNLRVNNGKLVGDIEILSTPAGEHLKQLLHNGLVLFKPYGFANVDNNGNMTNYQLVRIDAIYTK